MHRHHREDEFTFVREGRVGFILEDLFRTIDSMTEWPDPSVFLALADEFGTDMDLERTAAIAEDRGLEF